MVQSPSTTIKKHFWAKMRDMKKFSFLILTSIKKNFQQSAKILGGPFFGPPKLCLKYTKLNAQFPKGNDHIWETLSAFEWCKNYACTLSIAKVTEENVQTSKCPRSITVYHTFVWTAIPYDLSFPKGKGHFSVGTGGLPIPLSEPSYHMMIHSRRAKVTFQLGQAVYIYLCPNPHTRWWC